MWENLPNHLKTGLTIALVMVVGVAVAGFVLSFVALREVAANPVTGWATYAWIFPLCLDAALIAAEVTYISAGMIRGLNRALPFFCMLLFGAVTVWFNMERVPGSWRAVTAIPPVAGICMTLLIAYLLKALARVTGRTMQWDAPALADAGAITPYGPLHGSIHRTDPRSEVSHSDISDSGGVAAGRAISKREAVENYLARLGPSAHLLTAREVKEDLAEEGVSVSEQYVGRFLPARNGHGRQ